MTGRQVLAALLLCCLSMSARAAEIRAIPPGAPVRSGDEFTVAVHLGTPGAPVTDLYGVGFQLVVNPQALQLLGVTRGPLFTGADPLEFTNLDSVHGICAFSVSKSMPPGLTGDGDVATVLLRARTSAATGQYALGLQEIAAISSSGVDHPLAPEAGIVAVISVNDAACCFPDGHCEFMSSALCTGAWQGTGTVCEPNPCPLPTGRCCHPDGTCGVTTAIDCVDGTWTVDLNCASNLCPQPTGACCDRSTGACSITTQATCTFTWLGIGIPCDAQTCPPPPPPTGACCASNGICAVMIQTACAGSWTTAGTCVPNRCLQTVPGACCSANACRIFYKAYCERLRGVFNGAIVCVPDPCPRPWLPGGETGDGPPVENGSWGQIKVRYR